ncbi:MAG: hypothetical protein H7Y86_21130 [Rhizobacter sp.]|nr:hypothetical protein [Ferruginibacter sp.]
MKSFKKLTGLGLLLSLAFISCQKDFIIEEEPDPIDPPVTTNASNYLDKIYEIDSIAGVKDTTRKFVYEYDSRKRVSTLTAYIYGNNNNESIFEKYVYYYNANDTLPFKKFHVDYEDVGEQNNILLRDSTTTFYEYDIQGKNLYDSSVWLKHHLNGSSVESYTTIRVNRYQYAGNAVYNNFTTVTDDLGWNYILVGRDSTLRDANGNVLSSKRYDINNGANSLRRTATYTYDNKSSPFALLSNFRTLAVTPPGQTDYNEMQEYNNRITSYEITDDVTTYDIDLTGEFQYHANGYPYRVVADDDTPGYYAIYVFTYKSL